MHRCLIIEDDPVNAHYIADGLRELGYTVLTAADGVQGLSRAMAERWDVVVLDRMLPDDVDGLSIVSTLRSLGTDTPILVLSALAAIDERVKGLRAGCEDYLTKPFAFSELAARIAALVRRARPGEPLQEMALADLRLNLLSRSAERAGLALALQPREFRLLAYLMSNAGEVVTRTMLLEAVWDYRFDPHTNVIDVHISRRSAAETFATLLAAQERTRRWSEAREALAEAAAIVEGQVAAGARSRYDFARIRVEAAQLAMREDQAAAAEADTAAQLAAVVGATGWRPRAIGSLQPSAGTGDFAGRWERARATAGGPGRRGVGGAGRDPNRRRTTRGLADAQRRRRPPA